MRDLPRTASHLDQVDIRLGEIRTQAAIVNSGADRRVLGIDQHTAFVAAPVPI